MSTQAWLLWDVLFGAFGMGYFMYGKKQARIVALACGLGLMIFPYFIDSLWPMLAIGGALLALPWFVRA